MADKLNQQKTFLAWEESAVILQADARQGIDCLIYAVKHRGKNFVNDSLYPGYCSGPKKSKVVDALQTFSQRARE